MPKRIPIARRFLIEILSFQGNTSMKNIMHILYDVLLPCSTDVLIHTRDSCCVYIHGQNNRYKKLFFFLQQRFRPIRFYRHARAVAHKPTEDFSEAFDWLINLLSHMILDTHAGANRWNVRSIQFAGLVLCLCIR